MGTQYCFVSQLRNRGRAPFTLVDSARILVVTVSYLDSPSIVCPVMFVPFTHRPLYCHVNFNRPFLNFTNLMIPTALLVLLWAVAIINLVTGGSLTSLGIAPRAFPFGFLGIGLAPFIHSSLSHIGANSLPFFVTAAIINGTRGTAHFLLLSVAICVSSGLMVWIFGRASTVHVGASGLVFGYVGFLCIAAAVERNLINVFIALLVVFLYGSMLFGK